ncbi:hypothetical protein JZ751_007064 [Albula glossodonta]|uniref:Spondin domain-containing protein n=1 Tax=Albula glossodonta TaxID=121402 RepID=A0A8T2PDD2_9TELE|nr:hypothetical protein JZ751_007064 [Albula glossodonta]
MHSVFLQMMSSELLSPGWLQQMLVVLLKLTLSFAGPTRPANGTACTARGPASYILVFTGHWSPQTFPKQYPLFRPPAQWSKLIVWPPTAAVLSVVATESWCSMVPFCTSPHVRTVTHNGKFRLWQEGALASPGVQSFAERGVTVDLMKEAREGRMEREAIGHSDMGISGAEGMLETQEECVYAVTSVLILSLMVKIIPSPDWFVGVDSLNLCKEGQWQQELTLDLHPYDAGTDSGFTFSSPNFPTSPPENITQITSQNPNHPANSFYYPRLQELPPLASIRLTRQVQPASRQNTLSNHILPHSNMPQRFSETPLDCEVSLWSSWGLCLGPCAKGGVRHRTRYILLRPANSGTPCPELEEQAECTPPHCLEQH